MHLTLLMQEMKLRGQFKAPKKETSFDELITGIQNRRKEQESVNRVYHRLIRNLGI